MNMISRTASLSLQKKKSFRWRNLSNYLFSLPGLLFVFAFMIFPIFYNLLLSFQNMTISNLRGDRDFIGFANYATIFQDPLFTLSFRNSIIFTFLCIVFQFAIGFLLALYFNKKFPGRDAMRSLMLLAWMLPMIITAALFKWLFAGDHGIINYVLLSLGIIEQPIFWLSNSSTALYSTIVANIWVGIPFNMIILLGGLQSLPLHLYEAAKIDGANRFQQFTRITWPLLKPTIYILLMLGIIYTFKVFDLIFMMTGGGPVNASTVFPLYAYRLAFIQFDFSLGATVASFMFLILIIIATIYLWFIRKEEHE